jgi:hypothetical protein
MTRNVNLTAPKEMTRIYVEVPLTMYRGTNSSRIGARKTISEKKRRRHLAKRRACEDYKPYHQLITRAEEPGFHPPPPADGAVERGEGRIHRLTGEAWREEVSLAA